MTTRLPSALLAAAVVGLSAAPLAAWCAEVNLDRLVYDLAAQTQPARVVESHNRVCRQIPFVDRDCVQLSVSNIRTRDGGVRYSEVKPAPVPETVQKETFLFRNCSSSDRRDQKTLTVTTQEGYNIVTMDSVRSSNSATATLNIYGQQLGVTQSQDISFSESKTHSFTKSVTENVIFDEVIKAWTLLLVTVEKRVSNAYVDFDGDLLIDADVSSLPCCGWTGDSRYFGPLSALRGEAPVKVRGQLWNAKATATNKSYSEKSLNPNNPSDCPSVTPQGPTRTLNRASRSVIDKASRASVHTIRLSDGPVQVSDRAPVQVVVPFINGMTINTGNSIANVEVRAMSLAAGFCGVSFSTFGGSTQFLAPPQTWSPWTILVSHIGEASFTITNSVVCDVGVIAEVRYFK